MNKYLLCLIFITFSLSAKNSDQLAKDYAKFKNMQNDWDMLEGLAKERRIKLIKKLMKDKNGVIQYIACGYLIRSGQEDQTISTLAELITSGKGQSDLKGRMGYDWAHGDEKRGKRVFLKILKRLNNNFKKYSKEEQANALMLFKAFGLSGDYSIDKVNKVIVDFASSSK